MSLSGSQSTYQFELWSPSGVLLADISRLAHNRSYTLERNDAEILTFDLDLYAFEAFCAGIKAEPRTLLSPYQVDVKVKRNGTYLFGSEVVAVPLNLGTDQTSDAGSLGGNGPSSFNPTMSVTCLGYLNLFRDRYETITYTGQDAAFIAGDLLTQTQAQTNGDVGVTLAAGQYSTGVLRDRTYSRDNVKTAIQNLTQLVDGRFDFSFSYDKKFQTYAMAGAVRDDLSLAFGGPTGNIIGLYLNRAATSLYNRVIGLGSGFGPDQLVSIQDDTASQLAYYLREDIKQYNSVVEQTTLDENAAADLALEKDLLEIPQITISGKELAGLPFLTPGDRVPIDLSAHAFLDNLTGYYRIEKMVVNLDDNDFETITLYFDNFGLD